MAKVVSISKAARKLMPPDNTKLHIVMSKTSDDSS